MQFLTNYPISEYGIQTTKETLVLEIDYENFQNCLDEFIIDK